MKLCNALGINLNGLHLHFYKTAHQEYMKKQSPILIVQAFSIF